MERSFENLSPRTRAEAAGDVINHVRALGLEPHATSRLVTMRRVLERGYVPFDDPEFAIALEAMRDIQDLVFIFDELHAHANEPNFVRTVRHLLNDSVLPQHDRKNSPGRDAQFELYLAAVCHRGGMTVAYEEPDLRCTVEEATFAMAAKRLKSNSPRALRKHVTKAADQIHRAGHRGIVALDLTLARNQHNQPIVSTLHSQMYELVADAQNRKFFESHAPGIQQWVAGAGVLGVVVFDSRVRVRQDRKWGVDATMCWLATTNDDERAECDYQLFYKRFRQGFPKLVHTEAEAH